jgi:hypothetical protein
MKTESFAIALAARRKLVIKYNSDEPADELTFVDVKSEVTSVNVIVSHSDDQNSDSDWQTDSDDADLRSEIIIILSIITCAGALGAGRGRARLFGRRRTT